MALVDRIPLSFRAYAEFPEEWLFSIELEIVAVEEGMRPVGATGITTESLKNKTALAPPAVQAPVFPSYPPGDEGREACDPRSCALPSGVVRKICHRICRTSESDLSASCKQFVKSADYYFW
jgi:hypothetical protein